MFKLFFSKIILILFTSIFGIIFLIFSISLNKEKKTKTVNFIEKKSEKTIFWDKNKNIVSDNNSLVLIYFDETYNRFAFDKTDYENDGILSSSLIWRYASIISDGSILLKGNKYLKILDDPANKYFPSFLEISDEILIELIIFINPDQEIGKLNILKKYNADLIQKNQPLDYTLYVQNNNSKEDYIHWTVSLKDKKNYTIRSSKTWQFWQKKWIYLVAAYENGKMFLYINGVKEAEKKINSKNNHLLYQKKNPIFVGAEKGEKNSMSFLLDTLHISKKTRSEKAMMDYTNLIFKYSR